jgi:hypothetical protein
MYRIRASPVVVLLVIIMITLTACSTDAMEAPPTPTTLPPTPTSVPPTPTSVPPTPTTVPPTPTTPSPSSASVGTVTLSNTDCVLNANGPIEAGPIIIKATNNTDDFAEFAMMIITEGYSYDELEKHMQKEKELAEAGLPFLGDPGHNILVDWILLKAGETRDLKGVVVPGTYAIVCSRYYPQVKETRPFSSVGPLEVQ